MYLNGYFKGKLTVSWDWFPDLRWDRAGEAVPRALLGVSTAANYAGLESLRRSRYQPQARTDKISVWAGSFTVFLLDFADTAQSTSPDTALFAMSLSTRLARVEVARGLEFLDQHNVKKLHEDFNGHRDYVARTVIADMEKEGSAHGTNARSAVLGLSTSGGPRGWGREQVIQQRSEWVQGDAPLFKGKEQRVR